VFSKGRWIARRYRTISPSPTIPMIFEGCRYGDATVEVRAGQIVAAPAGVPHRFVNTGTGPLRQVDIPEDASGEQGRGTAALWAVSVTVRSIPATARCRCVA
jgi:hypothetical protein